MQTVIAAGQENAFGADALGIRMRSTIGQARVMRRRVKAHFAALSPFIDRDTNAQKQGQPYKNQQKFHAVNIGMPTRFSKIGANPCWS